MKKTLLFLSFISIVIAFGIFFPLSAQLSHALPNAIDPLFYAWNLSHNADTAFKGFDALLNTNIFYPLTNTIAYSDTLWGQSIITNPVIWITHNPILAENIAIFLSFPLSAISMFLLSMYVTRNTSASFAAGVFYAFSFPRLSQIGHLPMISSQWLPIYILYLFKFLDDGNRKNFIAVCLWYLLSITSSIYFGVFLLPITVIILSADLFRRVRTQTLHTYKAKILTAMPVMVAFLVVLGFTLFPYIRLKAENPEIKRSIDDMTHLRANPVDYLSVLPTSLNTFKLLPTNTNEHVLFPTFTLAILSVICLLTGKKGNRYFIWVFTGIALSSFVLSLGNEQSFSIGRFSTGTIKMPYYYLYSWFPVFQIVRVPARFGIFVILSLSALAAAGLDGLMKLKTPKWVVGLILCFFIIEIWQTKIPYVTIPEGNSTPQVYQWIQKQPEPMVIAEVPISLFYHGNSMEDQLYRTYDTLRHQDTYASETYRIYFSTFHKKRMINGYSGFLPDGYNKLSEILENFPSEYSIQSLRDIGVTHAVVHLWQYDNKRRSDITKALSDSPLLSLSYDKDDDRVYAISNNKL